ncbi:MAG TPA: efflux RND transporter periplasmic adaptor subunit [Armatimonadota bacterium]|jgi:HlyD family secretion protein
MASKRRLFGTIILAIVVLGAGTFGYLHFRNNKADAPTIKTAQVTRGDVTASVSATGVLQPLTTVEVKSNVGGTIVQLAVDEGDVVRKGQLIAKIDPADSLTALSQARADMAGAQAKVSQAKQSEILQRIQNDANVRSAEQAVEAASQRLIQASKSAQVQPSLTTAAVKQAQSGLAAAQATLNQTKSALVSQKLASAKANYDQARANYAQAEKNIARQRALLAKGFVPKSDVDSAEQSFGVAQAQLDTAKNKMDTVKDEADQDLLSAQAKVDQAKASLENARANGQLDDLKQQDVAAARATLKQAQASLDSAKGNAYQEQMKREDIIQSRASLAHTAASLKNAETQVGYTTVVAPSDGVVVKKYVENGSIVTAGRSSLGGSGAGVTIVDMADTNHMVALVQVDETDIAQVQVGQDVDITVDAYQNEPFAGKVTKVAPEAVVTQNVTTIPVTVEVTIPDHRLKAGMNATCTFITAHRANVLNVPSEAVKESDTGNGNTVTVLVNGVQETRDVEVGVVGTDTTEIMGGLKEGDTVVTAVIAAKKAGATPTGGSSPGGRSGGGRGGPRIF